MPIYIIYIFIISLAFGCKNGKLYILCTLSRLDENRHKIVIKIMKKLVYIKKIYKKYIIKHSYLLSIDFKLSNCFSQFFAYLFEVQIGSNSILCSEGLL
jgi:hypothetical protein